MYDRWKNFYGQPFCVNCTGMFYNKNSWKKMDAKFGKLGRISRDSGEDQQ